jgi:hypothetical protein
MNSMLINDLPTFLLPFFSLFFLPVCLNCRVKILFNSFQTIINGLTLIKCC